MRAAALLVLAAALGTAGGPAVDEESFRFVRELRAAGRGPILVEPDGPLHAHGRTGFADLRVVAADGRQVPWRFRPRVTSALEAPVTVLNRGRSGRYAVALVDRGPSPGVVERLELGTEQRGFVGSVEVQGADRRGGPFTRLSTTAIYDIRGARHARSTTALFPPTDFRFLLVRATGLRTIPAVILPARHEPERLRPRRASSRVRTEGRRTIVTLDLGYRGVPVDQLRVDAASERFDRPVEVDGSNDGRRFVPLGGGRVFRYGAPAQTTVPVSAAHRYLRVTIGNGDDPPLARLRVRPLARPRTLLVAGGYPGPLRLLYGNAELGPPDYDFAELPVASLALQAARPGRLAPERRNPAFGAGPEESLVARHDWLVQAALVVVALVVAAAALLAFRRRASEPEPPPATK